MDALGQDAHAGCGGGEQEQEQQGWKHCRTAAPRTSVRMGTWVQVLLPLGRGAQQQPLVDTASLESSLSGVLLKLQFIDHLLRPLPQGA